MSLLTLHSPEMPTKPNRRKKRERTLRWPVAASSNEAFRERPDSLPWVVGDTFPLAAKAAREHFPELNTFFLLCPFSEHWLAFDVRDGQAVRRPGILVTPEQQRQGSKAMVLLYELYVQDYEAEAKQCRSK